MRCKKHRIFLLKKSTKEEYLSVINSLKHTKTYQKEKRLNLLSSFPEPFTQSLINHPGHSSFFHLAIMHQMWKQIGLDWYGLLDGFFRWIFWRSCHTNTSCTVIVSQIMVVLEILKNVFDYLKMFWNVWKLEKLDLDYSSVIQYF